MPSDLGQIKSIKKRVIFRFATRTSVVRPFHSFNYCFRVSILSVRHKPPSDPSPMRHLCQGALSLAGASTRLAMNSEVELKRDTFPNRSDAFRKAMVPLRAVTVRLPFPGASDPRNSAAFLRAAGSGGKSPRSIRQPPGTPKTRLRTICEPIRPGKNTSPDDRDMRPASPNETLRRPKPAEKGGWRGRTVN